MARRGGGEEGDHDIVNMVDKVSAGQEKLLFLRRMQSVEGNEGGGGGLIYSGAEVVVEIRYR